MINKQQYIDVLVQAKNKLKNGRPWGEIWNQVKSQFQDIPNEQIDFDLGLEWREPNAYDRYVRGQLRPVKLTEKYNYFSDFDSAKQEVAKGQSVDVIIANLKKKYPSLDTGKLKQELGFTTKLKLIGKFRYNFKYKNIGSERELSYIFIGKYDGRVRPNKKEVYDFKWANLEDLKKEIKKNPDNFTPWFKKEIKELAKEF